MPRSEAAIEAQRIRNRKWYPANKERHKAIQDARVMRNNFIIDEAKAVPCVDCGERYHLAAMQFDHVRGEKVLPIARMKSYSVERLLAEIEKCEVRCANCHAIKTWGKSPRFQFPPF